MVPATQWITRHSPDALVQAVVPSGGTAAQHPSALPRLPKSEADRVQRLLGQRGFELTREPGYSGPFAWNLGRERARAALATLP